VGTIKSLAGRRYDPQQREIDLPLRGAFFPAGFRLNLATNSREVLAAAEESWGTFERSSESQPLELRVVVQPGDLAPMPTYRMQGHLFSIVSDGNNYAIGDARGWFGSIWITEKTAADHPWFRWLYLEALAYLLLAQRYVAPIHTACVARDGEGLLLCGTSGAGKSSLAFACARTGWTYVADDSVWLLADSTDRIAIGKPHQVRLRDDCPRLFPELAGYATSARPNGKLTIEVPLADFPEIRTAARCRIGGMVFLNRGGRARFGRIDPEDAMDRLLSELPTYGPEVDAMYERTVRSLAGVDAWEIQYDSLEDGIAMVQELFRR